tara:strand:- start:90 stop:539 length:450 start_codon:yes stop_codon:yes gene_type:complete
MKTILLFLSFFTLLSSCENDEVESNFQATELIFTDVGRGHLSNNSLYTQENIIIDNDADWQNLLSNFNSVNNNITDSFYETSINLDSFTVVAVIDTKNSSTTVDITTITENSSDVIVHIENLQMGLSQDVANPFHIVKMPKTTKDIVFE